VRPRPLGCLHATPRVLMYVLVAGIASDLFAQRCMRLAYTFLDVSEAGRMPFQAPEKASRAPAFTE